MPEMVGWPEVTAHVLEEEREAVSASKTSLSKALTSRE